VSGADEPEPAAEHVIRAELPCADGSEADRQRKQNDRFVVVLTVTEPSPSPRAR
jgi:hypothetical protein